MYLHSICKTTKKKDRVVVPWELSKPIEPHLKPIELASNSTSETPIQSKGGSITNASHTTLNCEKFNPNFANEGQQTLRNVRNGKLSLNEYPPACLKKRGIYESVELLKSLTKSAEKRQHS